MRKVVLFVDTTLDGFMGGPDGEMDWMVPDDEVDKEFTTGLRESVDTILTGRVTYQSFEGFWPAAATDPSSPPDLVELANWMVDTPKVVFSKTLDKVEMKNSRLATAGIAEEVAKLRQEPGKDLVVFGGASTVQEFIKLGLVDEFRMKVHPVAIGGGLPVFKDRVSLTLTRSKPYRSGVLGLYYEPVRQRITPEVDDAEAALREVETTGIAPAVSLRDEPWGQRHLMLRDPAGVWVDVVQPIGPDPEIDAALGGGSLRGGVQAVLAERADSELDLESLTALRSGALNAAALWIADADDPAAAGRAMRGSLDRLLGRLFSRAAAAPTGPGRGRGAPPG